MTAVRLITFDIFGTVLDWRTGLGADCAAAGRPLDPGDFDRIVDRQAELERGSYLPYAEITRRSLVDVLMSRRRGIAPEPDWWHVSAYADCDLAVAGQLGLTTVFVSRPHARPGPAAHRVADLAELAALSESHIHEAP